MKTVIFFKPEINIMNKKKNKRKYNRNDQRMVCLSEADVDSLMRLMGGKTKYKI